MFSFPSLPAGEPSTRNWYQELLDHPDCLGDVYKVQEAYESFRQDNLSKSISLILPTTDDGGNDDNTSPPQQAPIVPDQVLIEHLKRSTPSRGGESPSSRITDPLDAQDVNCEGILARPSSKVIAAIAAIQSRLGDLLGSDIHLIPASDLHLSVLELSHRHTLAHLRAVYTHLGPALIATMLDLPHTRPLISMPDAAEIPDATPNPDFPNPAPRLIRPMLLFDQRGVALTFVPTAVAATPLHAPYSYHHLRADLQAHALRSGLAIDTCYTAPTAHVTLGRFVGTQAFFARAGAAAHFVAVVHEINEQLRTGWDSAEGDGDGDGEWVVAGERGLEWHLGYLKFGRGSEMAEMVGKSSL
ncbi:hypothetical protein MMC07_005310 [Pseudocyphellaria aurata]|nr:hypothetical protein [Pseudocyphellaria aurata]